MEISPISAGILISTLKNEEKPVSMTGTSNNLPQYIWDKIIVSAPDVIQ